MEPLTRVPGPDEQLRFTKTAVRENLAVVLDSGKPLVVAQSADPVSDRRVTVKVVATVMK